MKIDFWSIGTWVVFIFLVLISVALLPNFLLRFSLIQTFIIWGIIGVVLFELSKFFRFKLEKK